MLGCLPWLATAWRALAAAALWPVFAQMSLPTVRAHVFVNGQSHGHGLTTAALCRPSFEATGVLVPKRIRAMPGTPKSHTVPERRPQMLAQ